MSEVIKFKAEPRTVIHNGSMIPIKFDSRGEFETSNARDIEILRKRKYVEEVGAEPEEQEGVDADPKPKKEAKGKKGKAAQEGEPEEQEAPEAPVLHTITEEDLKSNPALAEKYKVGDGVDLANL